MGQAKWENLEAARRGLGELEQRMSGGLHFGTYLAQLQAVGQPQCTTVWTKTTIAYRCRTCQVNDSSAICVSCFQAGEHREHDYVMYHSDSGGCCDCGDLAAWKEEGFCQVHRSFHPLKEPAIPPHIIEVSCEAVKFVLEELCCWVELIMKAKSAERLSVSEVKVAEAYIVWFQKLCSVAALRRILCKEATSKVLTVQDPGPISPLETLLSTYARMPESLMESETTLFLQMLYDQEFKNTFSRALVKHYESMILPLVLVPGLLADYKALDQSLDRVMVQLFNVPEITLNLIQNDCLLECFTSVLASILDHCMNRDTGTVNVDHPAITGKVYGRPQGDLKLIVAHEAVAVYILQERSDVFQTILSILALLQWMNPYTQTQSVDFDEQMTWTQAITIEMNTMAIVFLLIGRCFSAFQGSEESSKNGLLTAAQHTIGALLDYITKVKLSQGCQDSVSLHIPLHRTLSATVSKLVLLPWTDSSNGFLGALQETFTQEQVLALMEHPLRVTAWMAQIRANLWHSSEDFSRLELIYRGSIWHDQSMDMDILMLQFCAVAGHDMEQSFILNMAEKFNVLDMITTLVNFGTKRKQLTLPKICILQDFMRLLLLIIRERRNTGMTEIETLRYDVIQWLCVRDQTYSQLGYNLSASAMSIDQSKLTSILHEVAIYNVPKVQERGFYQLKPECWKEFDPLFAHFYINDLEEAQERATSVGKVNHHWRLQHPPEAKPPFNQLINLLHTEACHQLLWNVIHIVTMLINDETTATAAEALGVTALQIMGMTAADSRAGDKKQQNSCASKYISFTIHAKPSVDVNTGKIIWDQQDSPYPSVYEMLTHLQKAKDSIRLVDSVEHFLHSLSCTITNSSSESGLSQAPNTFAEDKRHKLKKQRQEAILADFAARQKAFMDTVGFNDGLLNDSKEPQDLDMPSLKNGVSNSKRVLECLDVVAENASTWMDTPCNTEQHECAFCRSECDGDESPTGWIALVQRYNLPSLLHSQGQVVRQAEEATHVAKCCKRDGDGNTEMLTIVSGVSQRETYTSNCVDLHLTEHVRCCGHQMHQMCFQRYADSLLRRHYARCLYEGKGIIELSKMDFLCPICRRLANALLPDVTKSIPWNLLQFEKSHGKQQFLYQQDRQESVLQPLCSLEMGPSQQLKELDGDEKFWKHFWHTHQDLEEAIRLFASQCLRVRKKFLREPPDLEGFNLCQILWEVFSENIIHCEVETREGGVSSDSIASCSSSHSSHTLVNGSIAKGDGAHWLAIVELGKLALLMNTIPNAASVKQQKRTWLVEQWLGLEENLTTRMQEDVTISTATCPRNMKSSSFKNSSLNKPPCQDVVVDEVSEVIMLDQTNPEFSGRTSIESLWADEVEYKGKQNMNQSSHLVADSKEAAWRQLRDFSRARVSDAVEVNELGWLWNSSKHARNGFSETGDPFEILIMLLVTSQGWPSVHEILSMVKITYIVAITQASVAFDKLDDCVADGSNSNVSVKESVLQVACLPFLRRATLLIQILVRWEEKEPSGGPGLLMMDSESLRHWLCLPTIQQVLNMDMTGVGASRMHKLWQNAKQLEPRLYKAPRQAQLAKLPEIFQELWLQNLKVPCLNCHRLPREPAICLLCGKLLCCGTDCCNIAGVGECHRHADKESVGVGLYLLMGSTQLLLLRNNRMCMAPSLYLDLHGEEDAYLKRGHPLHLCQLRLKEVRRLWLTAAFDHDSHILHTSQLGGRVF